MGLDFFKNLTIFCLTGKHKRILEDIINLNSLNVREAFCRNKCFHIIAQTEQVSTLKIRVHVTIIHQSSVISNCLLARVRNLPLLKTIYQKDQMSNISHLVNFVAKSTIRLKAS